MAIYFIISFVYFWNLYPSYDNCINFTQEIIVSEIVYFSRNLDTDYPTIVVLFI